MTAPTVTRLHISPLNPDLLPAVLGSKLAAVAQNVSYHQVQSFPENNYGYLDLPTHHAHALKKKLHDAILKGRKMKIDDARPSKRKLDSDQDDADSHQRRKSARSKDKEHSSRHVLQGHELSPDRRVKRGWTEPKSNQKDKKDKKDKSSKKPQHSSKYTQDAELLFRTRLPPNKDHLSSKKKKAKKTRPEPSDANDLVHEFEHRTKHASFLKDNTSSSAATANTTYVDGKGWVDPSGNLAHAESQATKRKRQAAVKGLEILIPPPKLPSKNQPTVDNDDASTSASADSSTDQESSLQPQARVQPATDPDETSSSGSSGSSSNDDADPADRSITPTPKVHPLEALFKKPKGPTTQDVLRPSLEVETSFSFFGTNHDTGEDFPIPATPFTSQDMRSREVRSAAPTPQTATVSRFGSVVSDLSLDPPIADSSDNDDNDDDDDDDDGDTAHNTKANSQTGATQPQPAREQSEFEKRFWEERGANNRAWKARRKAVIKEKRQRENRARRPKNW